MARFPRFHTLAVVDMTPTIYDGCTVPLWLATVLETVHEQHPVTIRAPREGVELGAQFAARLHANRLRTTVMPLSRVWPEDVRSLLKRSIGDVAVSLDRGVEMRADEAARAERLTDWLGRLAATAERSGNPCRMQGAWSAVDAWAAAVSVVPFVQMVEAAGAAEWAGVDGWALEAERLTVHLASFS